jgi:rod shape-determining protein MreC
LAESERGPMFAEGAGSTLALVGYIAIAVALMVADRRGGYLIKLRTAALEWTAPLYRIAQWPGDVGQALSDHLTDRERLIRQSNALEAELVSARTELTELRSREAESQRIRALVDFAERKPVGGRIARLINVDLDPFSHRVALDKGNAEGVRAGAVLFDGQGIVGQVIEVAEHTSVAMLISDPNHAIPVLVARGGLRAIVVGSGRTDELQIDDLPVNADIQVGDVVTTSGLGGRFAPDFAVGTVVQLERDPGAAFMRALVKPAGRPGQTRELMVLPPVEYTGPNLAPGMAP